MLVYHDFSKTDKKLLEPLITVCVQNEIAAFTKETLSEYQQLATTQHEDIRVPYWAFFEKFKDFSKQVQKKYDGFSHREMPFILVGAWINGYLKEEDFADFSEDGKAKFVDFRASLEAMRD